MTYDSEYNSFRFKNNEIEIILNCLSYSTWNDKCLTEIDRTTIGRIYKIFDDATTTNPHYKNVTAVVDVM